MKKTTGPRFVLAAVIVTLICVAMLTGLTGFLGAVGLINLFILDREELTRPVPRGELWKTIAGIAIGIPLLLAAIILAGRYFPHSRAQDEAVRRILSNPLLVAGIWSVLMWAIYGSWRRQAAKINLPPTSALSP